MHPILEFTEIGKLNNDGPIHIVSSDKTELRKLQDEINTLTKKNCELENLLIRKETKSVGTKDCLDGNGSTNKLKELEKNYRQLKQEKDECHKVIYYSSLAKHIVRVILRICCTFYI
jgi:hypothetical protein